MNKTYICNVAAKKTICLSAGFMFFSMVLSCFLYADTVVTSGEEASISSPAQADNTAIKNKIEELNNAEVNGVKLFFHPPLPLLKSE